MSNLIIAVICIGLAVAVASMGAIYISPNVFKAKEYKHSAEAGFTRLKVAYDIYVSYKGEKPSIGDWEAELNSVKINSIPLEVQAGFVWSYANNNFCLSGNYNPAAMMGFKKAKQDLGEDRVFINSTCGATTDDLTITTGTLAVTYWIAL